MTRLRIRSGARRAAGGVAGGRAAAVLVSVVIVSVVLGATAGRAAETGLCAAPPGGVPIVAPLEHFAARIDKGGPLEIVAVGSSSTLGVGASSPDLAYPSRLEADLRQLFPHIEVHVVNRGKGGEDAPEELARLSADVVALHPDLVIWQVGTNAILRRDDLAADGERLREGVDLLKRNGSDVVLMDLQYAPRVLDRSAYPAMQALIAETAERAHVGLFRRFALMHHWQDSHAADAPAMVGPDGLHMTDIGYGCLAADLTAALKTNWRSEARLAQRAHIAARSAVSPAATNPNDPQSPVDLTPGDLRPGDATPGDLRRNDAKPFN